MQEAGSYWRHPLASIQPPPSSADMAVRLKSALMEQAAFGNALAKAVVPTDGHGPTDAMGLGQLLATGKPL